MKNRLMKYLASKDWIYKLIVRLLCNRIVHCDNILTPYYLNKKGWIFSGGYYFEPRIKDRDKIWIEFEHHHFRVYHGPNKTFIALESRIEWFETYYLLLSEYERIFELSGV